MKPLYIGIAVIAVILLIVWIFTSTNTSDIPTYTVVRDDFNIFVVESGTIRAKNSSTIQAPRTAGSNLQIVYLAPEGTIVEKDEVLVRFDPSAAMKVVEDKETELKTILADLDKLKAQQSADKEQARTDFETAKLNFELAKIAKERMEFEPEAKKREAELEFERSKLAFEQAKNNLENKDIVRKSELNNLNLKISQIRSDLEEARKEMEQLTLKAPISGLIVYENNWATGRKIAVGDQPWRGMPLISVPDLSEAQVEVSINEMDIAKVEKDQKVKVIPDAFPNMEFTGNITSVSQIGRQKSSGSNIKVFDIIVDLNETDEVLKPGITTTNKVIVETISGVLSVPIISVIENEGKTFVFKQNGSGFDRQEVTLGEKNDNFVVVKKGLEVGDKVALRNPEVDVEIEGSEKKDPVSPLPSAEG